MARVKTFASIDVGSSKIATIIAQRDEEQGKIRILGVSSVPSGGVRKGQIVDIEETASAVITSVEKAERMAGFAIDKVVAVINGGHISCQNSHGVVAVASPDGEIEPSDVDRAIDAARAISLPASREIIHVIPSEFIVDSEGGVKDPVGMSAIRLEVETHLVTASTTALKNLNKCISEVGAQMEHVIFSGLAASGATVSDTERELGVVLIDLGAGTTSLAVFVDGALIHSRVFPIGAKNITNDIAIGLRTSLENAEKIKLAVSTADKSSGEELDLAALGVTDNPQSVSKKTLTDGIIRPRLNEVFSMIGIELKSTGLGGRTPAGVVLVGGGALTAGAVESAKRMLALPVRIGAPMDINGLIDDLSSPAYAATVGAVLWSARSPTTGSSVGFSALTKTLGETFNVPMKGMIGRVVDVVKSLLP